MHFGKLQQFFYARGGGFESMTNAAINNSRKQFKSFRFRLGLEDVYVLRKVFIDNLHFVVVENWVIKLGSLSM